MPIDVDAALNAVLDPIEFSWASSDVQLYQLALGAGSDPMDPRELRYLVDDAPQVLPTFATVAATFHATKPPTVRFPGIDIELSKVLHASERVEVPAPLPPSGSARAVTRFTDIWDKGKAAVIWSETRVTTPDGELLWTQKRSIYARGEGGFGGERGPSTSDARRSGHPICRWRCRCCRSRRCSTACAETAIPCTPIPNSPLPQAFPRPSCMGCAPTA
ncbi:metal-binding domain of MaoC dehydratase family protein [Mycobacterium kansasii 732]|nr:metal-binding domain of MaoC dehydratase family protein [Mycobacterium kansasii 732]